MGNYTEYKGFYIEKNFYGTNEFSVQFCGDDLEFSTLAEAKAFIDSVSNDSSDNIEGR